MVELNLKNIYKLVAIGKLKASRSTHEKSEEFTPTAERARSASGSFAVTEAVCRARSDA